VGHTSPPAASRIRSDKGCLMARAPKYGLRSDGRALNPWRSNDDARALGYLSTTDFRKARGRKEGLSAQAAVGHARSGEPTAADLREARLRPETAPLRALHRTAQARATAFFGDNPKFDPEAFARRVERITDRDTLVQMMTVDRDGWIELARHQTPSNPFHYH
jgi:hypothetical protein